MSITEKNSWIWAPLLCHLSVFCGARSYPWVAAINHLASDLWFSLHTWSSWSMINNQLTLAHYKSTFHSINYQIQGQNAYYIFRHILNEAYYGLLRKTHDHVLHVILNNSYHLSPTMMEALFMTFSHDLASCVLVLAILHHFLRVPHQDWPSSTITFGGYNYHWQVLVAKSMSCRYKQFNMYPMI